MMFTKCASCRKWDECARCGTCHTCRPDVRDACVAVRAVKEAQTLQAGHATRKRQSSPFAPGMGQNGTRPRASDPRRNWWQPVWNEEKAHPAVRPAETRADGDDPRVRRLSGDARRKALYTSW